MKRVVHMVGILWSGSRGEGRDGGALGGGGGGRVKCDVVGDTWCVMIGLNVLCM